MYGLTTITPPAIEPIPVSLAKLHLRIGHDVDDDWVNSAIVTARELTEKYTGQRWITQTVRLTIADFEDTIEIPIEPVQSVEAVKYLDEDQVEQTVDADDYQTWLDHSPPLVAPLPSTYWPLAGYGFLGAVRVEFTAGYGGAASDVPEAAKTAMLLCLGAWDEGRAGERVLPPAARALLDLHWTGG